jgi:predicted PhzF superfamily epimerase YddE/YHI9
VLLSGNPDKESVRFRTRTAGLLEVRRAGEGFTVGLPAIRPSPAAFPEAVAALGGEPLEVWRHPDAYNLFLYASEAEVRALQPDFRALAALGIDSFIATAAGETTDIVSRVFVPGSGVDEDPVTGSAHCVLTPFWSQRLGRSKLTAHQASARGGYLTCSLEGERVWLEGQCVTVVEGRFFF